MSGPIEMDKPPEESPPRRRKRVHWRTSTYQKFSGFLLSLILFLGVVVSGIFLLWNLNRLAMLEEIHHSQPVKTTFVEGPEDGYANTFETPTAFEVTDLTEPSLEESLTRVIEAANKIQDKQLQRDARSAFLKAIEPMPNAHEFFGNAGQDTFWLNEHYQLNFAAKSQEIYASQIDYLGIELGVVGGGTKGVDVATHLSTHPTSHLWLPETGSDGFSLMWNPQRSLREYETALVQQAGIEVAGRSILWRIPKQLKDELSLAALQFEKNTRKREPRRIGKTGFQCVPNGKGYGIRVVSQDYL